MNQRIKELISQCTETWDDFDPYNGYRSGENFNQEKFAELIVRHCTYQCYLIGESGLAHELSDDFGFKFDFRKMMEDEDE